MGMQTHMASVLEVVVDAACLSFALQLECYEPSTEASVKAVVVN